MGGGGRRGGGDNRSPSRPTPSRQQGADAAKSRASSRPPSSRGPNLSSSGTTSKPRSASSLGSQILAAASAKKPGDQAKEDLKRPVVTTHRGAASSADGPKNETPRASAFQRLGGKVSVKSRLGSQNRRTPSESNSASTASVSQSRKRNRDDGSEGSKKQKFETIDQIGEVVESEAEERKRIENKKRENELKERLLREEKQRQGKQDSSQIKEKSKPTVTRKNVELIQNLEGEDELDYEADDNL